MPERHSEKSVALLSCGSERKQSSGGHSYVECNRDPQNRMPTSGQVAKEGGAADERTGWGKTNFKLITERRANQKAYSAHIMVVIVVFKRAVFLVSCIPRVFRTHSRDVHVQQFAHRTLFYFTFSVGHGTICGILCRF